MDKSATLTTVTRLQSTRRQSNFRGTSEDVNRVPMATRRRSRHQVITRTMSDESDPGTLEARWRCRRRLTRSSLTDAGSVGPKRRLSSIAGGSECDLDEIRQKVNLRRSLKDKQRKVLLNKFRLAVKLVISIHRMCRSHILRNNMYDDIAPYVGALHFHDSENRTEGIELLFDPTNFKADKRLRISEETKRVLSKWPETRTDKELYYAQIALRNIQTFADYPVRMQRNIVSVAMYEKYEAKRVIVRQGHQANSFYIILSGSVVVMVSNSETNVPKPVAYMHRGMAFGELAIINRTTRQSTVIAKETLELLSINTEDFHRIFMAGGIKNINDPDHNEFIKNVSFLKGWPLEKMAENPQKCIFHYFRRGDILVRDSNYSDWIYIVKSGSLRILKKLRKIRPFEWKRKGYQEPRRKPTNEEEMDALLKENQRRYILSELRIPLRRDVELDESESSSSRSREQERSDMSSFIFREQERSNMSSSRSREQKRSDMSSSKFREPEHSDMSSSRSREQERSDATSSRFREPEHSDATSSRFREPERSDMSSSRFREQERSDMSSSRFREQERSDMSSSRFREKGRSDTFTRPGRDSNHVYSPSYDNTLICRASSHPRYRSGTATNTRRSPRNERLTNVLSSILWRKKTLSTRSTSGSRTPLTHDAIAGKSLPNINAVETEIHPQSISPDSTPRHNSKTGTPRSRVKVMASSARHAQLSVNSGQQSARSERRLDTDTYQAEVEQEMQGRKQQIRTITDDFDAACKQKSSDLTEADLNPQFVQIQTLTKGQVFGVSETVLGDQPSLCVISNGAECIMLHRSLYIQHASEALLQRVQFECCPYPSDEQLQAQLQTSVDWVAYKHTTLQRTLNCLKSQRALSILT